LTKICCSVAATALASRCRFETLTSTSARTESFRADGRRLVPELDQQSRRLLDERRRPTHVDGRLVLGRRRDLFEHGAVDPPTPPWPCGRRRTSRERDPHCEPV